MKYIGIFLLLIAAAATSREYSKYMKKRALECKAFLSFIAHMRVQVGCFLRPVKELAAGFSSPMLEKAGFIRALGDDAPKAAAMLALLGSAPHSLEADLLAEAALSPCVSVGGLAVGGRDLIAEGIASGPSVGHILSLLLEAVIDDPSLNEKQLLIDAARELVDHHE